MGRIFDIQRYSIHDGSGIRTIVFFKGCFLRCKWCSNPESQRYEFEEMGGKTVGKDVTVAEVMAAVERDRAYYRRSGGGVTLSGGEVLAQPDFARDILKAAWEKGIHTSIESTAHGDFCEIEKLLPFLDEFLLDIKHIDPQKHAKFTGKTNDNVLKNAIAIAESGKTKLIIRVPVIPVFNATKEEIGEIAAFAKNLRGVEEIHLLPYHRYGEKKYALLGRDYPMGNIGSPDEALMASLKNTAETISGLTCQIGG